METKSPVQHSKLGRMLKKALHTKAGAYIGYKLGLHGFNVIESSTRKFIRFAEEGEMLDPKMAKKGAAILPIGDTGKLGLYSAPKTRHAFNSRVNKGAALEASLLAGSSLGSITSPLPPLYIALSTATLTPAAGDTTLTSETVVAGLGRALGSAGSYTAPASLDAACSYVVSKTFTLTGSATTIVSAALFDAVSSGNLYVEGNLSSSAVLATNDQLTINWTINL